MERAAQRAEARFRMLVLTGVFAFLSVRGSVPQEFQTIFTVIISFYFGTQAAKAGTAK